MHKEKGGSKEREESLIGSVTLEQAGEQFVCVSSRG